MELIVKQFSVPSAVEFNYDELKQALAEKCEEFTGLVYVDENIKDAKKDKADLNRLKKELNDRRIALQKEYLAPFDDFKKKVDELIGMIEKPVAMIDAQVKDYEERKKDIKRGEIRLMFADIWETDIPFEMVEDPKWYNASTSMSAIREEIEQKNESIKYDLQTIQTLKHPAVARECYLKTLDIRKALEKSNEYDHYLALQNVAAEEKKEAEKEAQKDEQTFEVTFACTVTASQARKLKEFFEQNGIPFRKVEK